MKEIILAGRPNSGKSTLFNQLASANQKVGNYAGCTVEKKTATVMIDEQVAYDVTDLPGLYSLKPNSLDEEVALKHLEETKGESKVVFVLDGNNLEQELVLPLMLKKRGFHLAIAVNMMDEVRANKRILNLAGMNDLAGIPFFPISAKTGEGVESLKKFLHGWDERKKDTIPGKESELPNEELNSLHKNARSEARRLNALNKNADQNFLLERDNKIDRVALNSFVGPILFFAVMFFIFQSIFTWAAPVSDLVEAGIGVLQELVKAKVHQDTISSLLADGVLAGMGSVLVFVPQIAILFFLIGILEYSGYLPRVAYMVDRLMKPYGLDGKVFIPLLSSVACAVPGIMATRTIESERTRITTIMISPLMTCSARLPVYTLLIATFIPHVSYGPFSLPGLVMFGMYAVAVVVALLVALVMHKMNFQKRRHVLDFMHLPHYRMPNWTELFRYVWARVQAFLRKAGTIIASMSILLWVLLSYPKNSQMAAEFEEKKATVSAAENISAEEKTAKLDELEHQHAAYDLEYSVGGRVGKAIAPAFAPIGYDWKLTIGILSSLAAREVFVATMGTVFALGSSVDENSEGLVSILRNTKKADGTPAYTIATCLSLLMFFAFSLQCISTIGVAKRETNSWKIPLVMFTYMFIVAYTSAFIVYQAATWWIS